ncbi:TPA: hypothetical protein ACXLHF_004053 [Klebsiella pneumoniae]
MNLLTETLDAMKEVGKTPDDVMYVKMTKHTGFWTDLDDSYPNEILVDFDVFKELANRYYNNGYGSSYVNQSTAILFKDNSVMYRWEYDGAEGWEYITLPRTSTKKYNKKMVAEFLWGKGSYRMEDDDE